MLLRVLVVDDTVIYRKVVADVLSRLPGVEVVGVAAHGRIALQKIEELRPDLLTLDLEMPEMDGLALLQALRERSLAVGAIMLSAFTTRGAEATVAALKLGAFDFVVKPSGVDLEQNVAVLEQQLRERIEAFARVRVKSRSPAVAQASRVATTVAATPGQPSVAVPEGDVTGVVGRMGRIARGPVGKPELVAIGISTGGPQALSRMLPMLPADLSVPVLIVQHMPPKFTLSLAQDLAARCKLRPSEAVDGDEALPGRILIAPGGRQMKVERRPEGGGLVVRIADDPPENHCRPSVDYLFRSVAHTCGGRAVGVIMTGMGSDGALGCKLLKRQGARIVAQDEASCVVFGMPRIPVEEGIADVVAPLSDIAGAIARIVWGGATAWN